MNNGVEYYIKQEGPGRGYRYYLSTLFMLEIDVNADYNLGHYRIRCDKWDVTGTTHQQLYAVIKTIIADNGLVVRKKCSKDVAIIYVNDLDLIKAFFPKTTLREGFQCWEYKDVIQFRSWHSLLPKGINLSYDDIYYILTQYWQPLFKQYKRPFLTLPQYPRKTMLQRGQASALMPDNISQLDIMYESLHQGLLYTDGNTDTITSPIIGIDLVSAYIHAIVFHKHCCSKPIKVSADKWEEYIYKEDKGCIGWYDIEYECNHPAIYCYKEYFEQQNLSTGHHTVRISLCDIDLINLINFEHFRIINITCKALYVYDIDYLPKSIRDYCIAQFIKKCTTPHDTLDYALQKTILNSGFFGNFLHESKQYLENENRPKYYQFVKDASACPLWGVYTCAYVRKDIITLALQVDGWHYSDTDSIYCDSTQRNEELINNFNLERWIDNMQLCDLLGYTDEQKKYIVGLGQFKPSEQIIKFRYFTYKRYAYLTVDGKLTVKAAGALSTQKYDESIFDNIDYTFKMPMQIKTVDKNYYRVDNLIV